MLVHQFEMPFVVDGSAFAARYPRFRPTPYANGVARTVAWYREPAPDAAAPDREPVVVA